MIEDHDCKNVSSIIRKSLMCGMEDCFKYISGICKVFFIFQNFEK